MNKVLFLASWYPGRVNAFDGDFIELHAQSISLYNRVFVIYVVKDPGIKNGKISIEKESTGNLVTYKAYYPHSNAKYGWIEKLHSNRWHFKLHQHIYKTIVRDYGRPDIVHLNVLMKAGLFAWWLKKIHQLPYVLSENWTGYYKERKEGYLQKSRWYKFLSKMVFENCCISLPVTKDLGERMNELLTIKPFRVIPNVVDTTLFYPALQKKNGKTRLIHISTLGYHKNIEGLLQATGKLFRQRKDFELYLVGQPPDDILQWTKDQGLLNNPIVFLGLMPYTQVAEELRGADALIMFSRYENLPCVILEALTSGLPVLSTDVGGIREVITESNGMLIPSERGDELLKAMDNLLNVLPKFDKQKIASSAKNTFSFETVGRQFDDIYKAVLKKV